MKTSKFIIAFIFAIFAVFACIAQTGISFSNDSGANPMASVATDQPAGDIPGFVYYLLAIAGVILHILAKIRDAQTQNESIIWSRHIIWSFIGIIVSSVIIFCRDYFPGFLEITPVTAVLVGYFSDSIWKNIENTYRPKLGNNI